MDNMIENYVVYLKFLDDKINKFFEKQQPYVNFNPIIPLKINKINKILKGVTCS